MNSFTRIALAVAVALGAGACSEKRSHPQPSSEATRFSLEIEKIAQSDDPDRENRVAAYLTHGDVDVVASACFQLGQLKARDYIPQLLALLEHKDGRVVNMAGAGLREMIDARDAKLAPRFEAVLAHEFLLARISAVEALGRIRSTDSVGKLLERLKMEDAAVRYYIVASLGEIGSKQALPALEAYLSEVRAMDMGSPHLGRARGTPPHPRVMKEAIERAIEDIRRAT